MCDRHFVVVKLLANRQFRQLLVVVSHVGQLAPMLFSIHTWSKIDIPHAFLCMILGSNQVTIVKITQVFDLHE